jgi:hypothetical protein
VLRRLPRRGAASKSQRDCRSVAAPATDRRLLLKAVADPKWKSAVVTAARDRCPPFVKPEASDSSQVLPDLLKGGSVFETAGTRSLQCTPRGFSSSDGAQRQPGASGSHHGFASGVAGAAVGWLAARSLGRES